jgi:peptide-methionine (S)-S-oxide reductase
MFFFKIKDASSDNNLLIRNMKKIGFGGGCHWCTEAIFQALNGVESVEQGWISSLNPYDTFSEAVIVHFNEGITLDVLIEVHLLTHSSASAHSMRYKYRSAVYYIDPNDKDTIEIIINKLSKENDTKYITQTLPLADFRLNSERFLNYYKKDKQKPFCQTNINPKLAAIRKTFGHHIRNDF